MYAATYLVASALSIIPFVVVVKTDILTRLLAAFSAIASGVYGVAVMNGTLPFEMGALGMDVRFTPDLIGAESATSVLLLLCTVWSAHTFRRSMTHANNALNVHQSLTYIKYITLGLLSASVLVNLYYLGVVNLFQYSDYGSIKQQDIIFNNAPLAGTIAKILRIVAIFVIVFIGIDLSHNRFRYPLVSAAPLAVAIAIGIAEASRITGLYMIVFAFCMAFSRKKYLATGFLVAGVIMTMYALEARKHDAQGLSMFFQYAIASMSTDAVTELVGNYFAILFVTSATSEVAQPSWYPFVYKAVSFLPTPNFADGFQVLKDTYEQRVGPYIPFNAFGEAWAFGEIYFGLFSVIILISISSTNRVREVGTVAYLLLVAIFFLGLMYASQYPVRNSLRLFYAVWLIAIVLRNVKRLGLLPARKLPTTMLQQTSAHHRNLDGAQNSVHTLEAQ